MCNSRAAPAVVVEPLPLHAEVVATLVEAEAAEGWTARCDQAGRYLALNAPFIAALANVLRGLGGESVLEVCAGDGSLARALSASGAHVRPTDVRPPPGFEATVERLDAGEALRRHPSSVVLGAFVPIDSGVDQQVMSDPRVRQYVVLNARLGGTFGSSCLWNRAGWERTPLPGVARSMVTRHDVWLGEAKPPFHRGEAWLLSRRAPAVSGSDLHQINVT